MEVSEYLKDNGYHHKFLKSGDVSDGKVFTIYIGSKDLADRLAKILSQDLAGLLSRPKVIDGIEFAPNISGRFNQKGKGFNKYPSLGVKGFSTIKNLGSWFETDNKALSKIVFETSFNRLVELHGTYFTGS